MAKSTAAVLGLSLIGLSFGCNEEPVGCPAVGGEFWAEYQYLPGGGQPLPGTNACPVGPYRIMVLSDPASTVTLTSNYLNQTIISEVNLKGCAVGMEVTVNTPAGMTVANLDGDLDVISRDHMRGTVAGSAMDQAGNRCNGLFQANLTRAEDVIEPTCQPGVDCGTQQPPDAVFAGSGAPVPNQPVPGQQ